MNVYRSVPRRRRDVPKMCRDVLVNISEDYGSGSDGDGDRRCRLVGRLYSLIRNLNFVMMCDDCDLFDRER